MTPRPAAAQESDVEAAQEWIELLASEVGPRRPTSRAERLAAELMRDRLGAKGVDAELEPFLAYSTFGLPFAAIAGMTVLPGLLPRRWRRLRAAIAGLAAGALVTEGGLVWTPLSAMLSRNGSQNLVATIEPSSEAERTLCLVSHLDTSRSGLMFHPAIVAHLNTGIGASSLASLALAVEPLLARSAGGRRIAAFARAFVAVGIALLAERELRGEDVPGANDNASGAAVTAQLATEWAASPPESTRLVLLATGCEESGLHGAQAFLRGRDTSDWLFLNVDSVGGPATLRFIRSEGIVQKWPADPAMLRVAERIAAEQPDLRLEPAEGPIGLTYDTTVVLARGGRALTLVAGNGVIPNYHQPTDTADNVDPDNIRQALAVGREMIAAIDRGEAD